MEARGGREEVPWDRRGKETREIERTGAVERKRTWWRVGEWEYEDLRRRGMGWEKRRVTWRGKRAGRRDRVSSW